MIDTYVYIKFLWNLGNNHVGAATNVVQNLMIGVMFLGAINADKKFKSRRVYHMAVGTLGVVYVLGVILIGYIAVNLKLVDKENTIQQKHNQEIQQLLNQTK